MKLSERLARLGTETAFEVLVRARALEAKGRSVVHLEIGEPDFDTPAHVTEAGIAALKGGATHYGPAAGLPELRQAIAEDSTARRGVKATPEMVVVTPGGKPIMFYLILALVDPGDEVLYPNPGFPIYESMIRFIGGVPVPVRLLEEKGHALDVDQLISKITPKTRLIVLNYPHNPTGGVIPEAGLRAIADAAVAARDPGAVRRDLLADPLRRQARLDRGDAGHGVARDRARRLLEDLRDDRLAAGLRRHAGAARAGDREAADERRLLHRDLHAARRRPGAQGRPRSDRRDGGGVPQAPRRDRRGPAPDPGLQVRAPAGRLLRVSRTSPAPATGRRRSPTACSTRPASRASPARPSASGAKATCASATRTASRTSRKRCAGSRPASRSSARRRAQARPTAFARIHSWPTARWTKFLKKAGEFFS